MCVKPVSQHTWLCSQEQSHGRRWTSLPSSLHQWASDRESSIKLTRVEKKRLFRISWFSGKIGGEIWSELKQSHKQTSCQKQLILLKPICFQNNSEIHQSFLIWDLFSDKKTHIWTIHKGHFHAEQIFVIQSYESLQLLIFITTNVFLLFIKNYIDTSSTWNKKGLIIYLDHIFTLSYQYEHALSLVYYCDVAVICNMKCRLHVDTTVKLPTNHRECHFRIPK